LGGVAVILTVASGVGGTAWAQAASEPALAQYTTQGVPPRQEPDNRTPAEIAAENCGAPGVHVGSFLFFPELEADEAFNDNVFATSNATGKTASFVQGFKPSLRLNSDWSTHMLNFYATGAFGILYGGS
jgi:hypothetical protein